MILKAHIITDLEIHSVKDLYKLKPFLKDSILKINKSQIARELQVDRRTVGKYINGYQKPTTRKSRDCIATHYDIIEELLSNHNQQVFYYRKVLWQYLVDNHNYSGAYCNFCSYLKTYPQFDSYLKRHRPSNISQVTIRYETDMGKQAQLDWKESISFLLSNGETIEVNIFVLLLSYSRYCIYKVSLTKTQDILFSFLDEARTEHSQSCVIKTINKTKARHNIEKPLILYSDRGSQYVSKEYKRVTADMQCSYSKKPYPYDNA